MDISKVNCKLRKRKENYDVFFVLSENYSRASYQPMMNVCVGVCELSRNTFT